MRTKVKLGDMLVRLQLITQDILNTATETLRERGGSGNNDMELSSLLMKEGYVTKDQIIPVLEYLIDAKYVDLKECEIDTLAVKLLSERVARNHRLIPISTRETKILVVMADPLDLMARDDIRLITGLDPECYFAFWEEIERAININYTSSELAEQAVEDMEEETEQEETVEAREAETEVNRAPIVRLVNSILEQAVRIKASDIHIEPMEKNVKVRLRIDGDLKEMMSIPKSSHAAISARIKIMSNLNIAEKRLPQDGRIELKVLERPIDLRVSILPTVHGEKVVMRILDRSSISVTKEQLGFTSHNISLFNKIIKAPEGIILLSGPTGSGKTTTLYTVLKELNKPNVNIITVEDPVEYRLDGVHQVQTNDKAGLTFASALRSILRQDPDVVMIGEIRDAETAQIAARAAITGHVVLSTIHTNDTISTVSRLTDMGIELFMVATALVGVIAQRLVKRVCTGCKEFRDATAEELALLKMEGPVQVAQGTGCNVCGGTGYAGRIAIHEILALDKELRSMITSGVATDAIKERAREKGLRTLNESCKELVLEGITSIQEMTRVTYSIDE